MQNDTNRFCLDVAHCLGHRCTCIKSHDQSRLIPPRVRWEFLILVKLAENLVGYARESCPLGFPLEPFYTLCRSMCLCSFPVWCLGQNVEFVSISSSSFSFHLFFNYVMADHGSFDQTKK